MKNNRFTDLKSMYKSITLVAKDLRIPKVVHH